MGTSSCPGKHQHREQCGVLSTATHIPSQGQLARLWDRGAPMFSQWLEQRTHHMDWEALTMHPFYSWAKGAASLPVC